VDEEALRVEGLTTHLKIAGRCYAAVDGLSFVLKKGKTLALVGESGCGKTMAALSLLRLTPQPPALPSEGRVLYRGRNLLQLHEKALRALRGKNIAIIFQDPTNALNPVYTIGQQMVEVLAVHLNIFGEEAWIRAANALDEVGIAAARQRLDDFPHQLSGGMRQRVLIAMALLCSPDILIADEPTTALDVTIQRQVLELMRQLQRKKGMALLLVTHDLGVVAEMADDVIVMYASQAVEYASALQLFDNPTHPYTQGLFASRPAIANKKRPLKPIKGTVPQLESYPCGCHFNTRCPYAMDKCLSGSVPLFSIQKGQQIRMLTDTSNAAVSTTSPPITCHPSNDKDTIETYAQRSRCWLYAEDIKDNGC